MSKLKRKPKSVAKARFAFNKLSPLKKGDLIEIIAPGSYSPEENLELGAEVLRNWGFKVQYDKNLQQPDLYLSNTDEKRFKSFEKAIKNPKVKAIWCLRGGYGAIRLLPYLQKMKVTKSDQKLLIGLSDVSSLHTLINQKWNWPTMHGSLIDRLAQNKLTPENLSELKSTILDPDYKTIYSNLVAINKAGQKKQNISSTVVGGNLIVVSSTMGTPSQINAKGKILFFEEICERGYRVDRCLQQLKQSGVFDGVKAVIFGDFTDCNEKNGDDYVTPTLKKFFKDLNIPAYVGAETGHGPIQRPLFFNTEAHLTCGKSAKMIVYSAFTK